MVLAPDGVVDWEDIDGFYYKKKYHEDDLISELILNIFLKT